MGCRPKYVFVSKVPPCVSLSRRTLIPRRIIGAIAPSLWFYARLRLQSESNRTPSYLLFPRTLARFEVRHVPLRLPFIRTTLDMPDSKRGFSPLPLKFQVFYCRMGV